VLIIILQLYLAVNYDLQQFMLAPINTEIVGALDIVPFNNTGSFDCPSSPNKWSIGVIVLGVVLTLFIIVLCLYVYRKGRETRTGRLEGGPEIQEIARNNNIFPRGPIEAGGRPFRISDASGALEVVAEATPAPREERFLSNATSISPSTTAMSTLQNPRTHPFPNLFANGDHLAEMPSSTDYRA
jgi:hypothetical protein